MERTEIRFFLGYPDTALVDHAVRRANLSKREWQAIELRERQCLTVEQAAERQGCSVGTLKNDYNQGMGKLGECWGGLPWINSILKQ